jgi:tRNA acetyltransferase TAN1
MYGPEETSGAKADDDSSAEEADIEAEINKELEDIRKPVSKPLFTNTKLDTQCCTNGQIKFAFPSWRIIVIFFKTRAPIEPVSFVERLCQDIAAGVQLRNCRYVKRLTPITAIDKANAKGLEAVAKEVLAPHFHGANQAGKKVSSDDPIFRVPERREGACEVSLTNSGNFQSSLSGHLSVTTKNWRGMRLSKQSRL